MTNEARAAHSGEIALIILSVAAVASVILANVVRVYVSPTAAVETRAVLFAGAWIAAIAWGIGARQHRTLVWLGFLACTCVLIGVCQFFAGGISESVMLQLFGAGGAGIGAALGIKRALQGRFSIWLAGTAAVFGCGAAIWMALEPGQGLWKLLPNDWELSKHLDYRWGIRMGQDRARFLFDTPMEAGVVQWFAATICLAVSMTSGIKRVKRWILTAVALLLYASVALTYSRAGMALGAISIGVAILSTIRSRRATLIACACALAMAVVAGVVVNRTTEIDENPAVKNVASILDPSEEANRIRLFQFTKIGHDLAATPWHGNGAASFVTFQQAPRMPAHESSPVELICAFGIGGAALVAGFAWAYFSQRRRFLEIVVERMVPNAGPFERFVATAAPPFALYSLVAPIMAGLAFGMMCFTIMGLLAVWDAPYGGPRANSRFQSGNP